MRAAGVPVSAINWPIVVRITLQGAALCALTALTMWASGVEWLPAIRAGVLTGAGWLLGHLQREAGGIGVDLTALRKDNKP